MPPPKQPLLHPGQSAVAFVQAHCSGLSECACNLYMMRKTPGNVRDVIEQYIVDLLQQQNWPKERPIQIVDIGSEGLLQIASIVTQLVHHGYKVGLSMIDVIFSVLYENYTAPDPLSAPPSPTDDEKEPPRSAPQISTEPLEAAAIKERIRLFIRFLTLLNETVDMPDAVTLNGIFTSPQSYKTTAIETPSMPNLILVIDDVIEICSQTEGIGVTDQQRAEGSVDFCQREIFESLGQLNPNFFLSTWKSRSGVDVKIARREEQFQQQVIYAWGFDRHRIMQVTQPLMALSTTGRPVSPPTAVAHFSSPLEAARSIPPPGVACQVFPL